MSDSLFMGVPGGNSVPSPGIGSGGGGVPAPISTLGGTTNPLLPTYPTGSAAPNMTFPANTGGANPNSELSALTGLGSTVSGYTMGAPNQPGGPTQDWYNQLTKAFHKAGYPSAIGGLLAAFLANGAGYNPAVANAMIAALQPGIQRGQANIMEEFGAQGLSEGSPAAIGLGDFNSQVTLDEGQILSQMYEQSVQNYMNVLLSGKESTNQQGGIGSLIAGIGSGSMGIAEAFGIESTGGSGGSGSTASSPIPKVAMADLAG